MKIGFIGQWFIGGNMANDFEERGFDIVRYDIEKYKDNLTELKKADVVFVAVPTPTVNRKFIWDVLMEAIKNTVAWQKIIIKSTVIPGTTDKLQELYPDRYFFHSGEFLTEKTAELDVRSPARNVIWYTEKTKDLVEEIMNILPKAEEVYCTAKESELWKYFSNFLLTGKVVMANLMFDMCQREGADYERIKTIASLDPRIWGSHLTISMDGWRGANGHCFPKDIATLHEYYGNINPLWDALLEAMEMYNLQINRESGKNLKILEEVYGNMNTDEK
ncbi:MAG: hypothetical protein ACD_71C00239G0004 [uncultured bacterium (gcode 4)]|uniref:UDP-glucose/GDP-mannose dehydrogenase dimerization n=1 Tax=uncultured bacterium (gcode 4) TaxID=1234023 RepID=K1ZI64_9BACT|nr:MAG: hypothetical protein ACD_71C00239G0004 [uncultured bacterium (gcode 4)]